jgi:hypothetical protein
MSIRVKLYAAIGVTVAGLALTAGVGIWALNHLDGRFEAARTAGDARALALELKFAVTDFNGWQTAYGYDGGKSRSTFLASVARFRATLSRARVSLHTAEERRLLAEIATGADAFMKLDAVAWNALRKGETAEVRRLFLGPEIRNFQRIARAAQALADAEARQAVEQEEEFTSAKKDALRYLVAAAIVTALLVFILLITANDLARMAERALRDAPEALDG